MAVNNILDGSDPRELATERKIDLGTPRRETQYPADGSAIPESQAPYAPSVQEQGTEAGFQIDVPPPELPPTAEIEAPSVQLTELNDTSSVLQNAQDVVQPLAQPEDIPPETGEPPVSYTVDASTPPVDWTPPEAGVNVYDQINQGFQAQQAEANAAIEQNITDSFNNRPTLDRVYVNPFSSIEQIVGNVRTEYEGYNAERRAANQQATEQLRPKPALTPNAAAVLQQLPTLNSTNPILNQIPGGLRGQMGEAPGFDQRWFSGDVVGRFLDAARNVGQTIGSGDLVDAVPGIVRGFRGMFGNVSNVVQNLQRGDFSAALSSNFNAYQSASRRGQDPALTQRLQRTGDALRGAGVEALQGFLPQETENSREGNEQYRIDPMRGYFGEMGAGLPGLALYATAGIGNLANATVYTATDAIGALAGQRPQGQPGFNPFYRYGQVAQGVDLGFFNNVGINNNRYLSTILPTTGNGVFGADNPYANSLAVGVVGGIGFGVDMLTGGLADNAAVGLTRFARRRGLYVARQGLGGLNVLPNSHASQALNRLSSQQAYARAQQARRGIPDFNPANAPELPTRPTPVSNITQLQGTGATTLQGQGFTNFRPNGVSSGSADIPTVFPPQQIINAGGISGQQRLSNTVQTPTPQTVDSPRLLTSEELVRRNERVATARTGRVDVVNPTGFTVSVPTDVNPRVSVATDIQAEAEPIEAWVVSRARQLTGTSERLQVQVQDLGTVPEQLPGTTGNQPLLIQAIEPEEVLDDGRTLEDLFIEADRVGNQYQTPEEIATSRSEIAAVNDDIDQTLPDDSTAETPSSSTDQRPAPFTTPEGYQVNADRTNTVIDGMLDSGRPISERTMRVIPGVDTSQAVVEVRGRAFVRDGDNWVRQGTEAPRNLDEVVRPSVPVPVSEMPTTTSISMLARDISNTTSPNGVVSNVVASAPGVRATILDEAVANNVVRDNTDEVGGLLTDSEDEIQDLVDYIQSVQSSFDNISARIKAEPNSTTRLELYKTKNRMEVQLRDAREELAAVTPPVPKAKDAFNGASPVVTQSQLRSSMSVDEYRGYLSSPEYLNNIGSVDASDILPVRRTNKDLTRLAKFLTGSDGTPLMNATRKSDLNSREIARLRETHGDLFAQYGKPVPSDINNPQLRIEVNPSTVGAAQTTQFIARQPEVRVTRDDRLIDESIRRNGYAQGSQAEQAAIEAQRKADLYDEQDLADEKAAIGIEQARLDILAEAENSGEMTDEAIEGLMSLNKAFQEIPNAVDNPRVVRNYVENLAPNSMVVSPASDPIVTRFLQIDEELADQGQALRELNGQILQLKDDVAQTTNTLDELVNLKRSSTADEIANAVMYSDGDNFGMTPYQLNAIQNSRMAQLEAVDPSDVVDVSEYIPYNASTDKLTRSISGGSWFHGSQITPDSMYSKSFSPGLGSSSNELGAGFYLTKRSDLAQVYSRAERNITSPHPGTARLGTPTVYQFSNVHPRNTLNVSTEITPDVQRVFNDAVVETITDDASFLRSLREQQTKNNLTQDQWINVREAYEQTYKSPMSELQYQDFQRVVADKLYRELGYDSLLQADKFRGQTLVILDPTEVPGSFWNKAPLSKPVANSVDFMNRDVSIASRTGMTREEMIGGNLALGNDNISLESSIGGNIEALDARLNRHQSDALLNAAHQRKTTLAWEQQSRQALSGQMLDDYVNEYNNILDDGIAISEDRFRAMQEVKDTALREANQKLQGLIQTAPDVARKEAKKFLNINTDNPCL